MQQVSSRTITISHSLRTSVCDEYDSGDTKYRAELNFRRRMHIYGLFLPRARGVNYIPTTSD
jgi:hypothetical protein